MITFLTLFLGLFIGPQQVELDVVEGVASVELWLDGEKVGVREEPPWTFDCDFGPLTTHELEAVAFDEARQVIDRQHRWINLARPSVDASIRLLGSAKKPEAVAITWESLGTQQAPDVELWFDGRSLKVEDPNHVALPAYDPDAIHFINAVVRFDSATLSREARFGGLYGAEVDTELTSLVFRSKKRRRLVSPDKLEGRLSSGEAVRVTAVEKGAMEVIIVRDPYAQPALDGIANQQVTAPSKGDVQRMRQQGQTANPRLGLRVPFRLEGNIRFISTVPAPLVTESGDPFPRTEILSSEEGGLFWMMKQARAISWAPRPAEAVALAGMQAQASQRRRAVVLLLSKEGADESRFEIAEVRSYLEQLDVPLLVWATDPEISEAWGPFHHVKDDRSLEKALSELRDVLEHQRIVWVEGRYLPRDVNLVEVAGR